MKNESNVDRIIRAVLAVLFLYLGATVFGGVLSVVMYVLAAIMFVTAVTGFCPLYSLLGISTKRDNSRN